MSIRLSAHSTRGRLESPATEAFHPSAWQQVFYLASLSTGLILFCVCDGERIYSMKLRSDLTILQCRFHSHGLRTCICLEPSHHRIRMKLCVCDFGHEQRVSSNVQCKGWKFDKPIAVPMDLLRLAECNVSSMRQFMCLFGAGLRAFVGSGWGSPRLDSQSFPASIPR